MWDRTPQWSATSRGFWIQHSGVPIQPTGQLHGAEAVLGEPPSYLGNPNYHSVTDGVNKFRIVSRGAIYEDITKYEHKQILGKQKIRFQYKLTTLPLNTVQLYL